jgi:hypothetical protein
MLLKKQHTIFMNTHYEGIYKDSNKNRNDKKGWDVMKIFINVYAFVFTLKTFHTKPDDGKKKKKIVYM